MRKHGVSYSSEKQLENLKAFLYYHNEFMIK